MEQKLHNLLHRLYDAIPVHQEDLRDFLSSEYEAIAMQSLRRGGAHCNNTTNDIIAPFAPLLSKATHRQHQREREAEQRRRMRHEAEFQQLFEKHMQQQRDAEERLRRMSEEQQQQQQHDATQRRLQEEKQQQHDATQRRLQEEQQEMQRQRDIDEKQDRRNDIAVMVGDASLPQPPRRPAPPMTEERRKKIERMQQFERQIRQDQENDAAQRRLDNLTKLGLKKTCNNKQPNSDRKKKKKLNTSFLYNDIEADDNDCATMMTTTSPGQPPMTPCTPHTPMTIDID